MQDELYQSIHGYSYADFRCRITNYTAPNIDVVQILEGEDAIKSYRSLMGSTNPEEAQEGTLRKLFAESLSKNAVHGSDSPESAAREIDIMNKIF